MSAVLTGGLDDLDVCFFASSLLLPSVLVVTVPVGLLVDRAEAAFFGMAVSSAFSQHSFT